MNLYEKSVNWLGEYFKKVKLDSKLIRYYKRKDVLVTGGAGAIGNNLIFILCDLAGENGKDVILDNLSSIFPTEMNSAVRNGK
jgi:UDP-glucose 4-epimerase